MAEVNCGVLAMRQLHAAGVEHLFTLSGAHIFPLYDGCRDTGVQLVDTRHESTAVFAAEGLAKLTRRPQVVAVTAGPGVTNAMSGIASAQVNGSPLVVIGGRAPNGTWGTGALQEIDHLPFVAPLTKSAKTSHTPQEVAPDVLEALTLAGSPHRGPTFVDLPLDVIYAQTSDQSASPSAAPEPIEMDLDALARAGEALRAAARPVVIAGTDVWLGGAWQALRDLAEQAGVPVVMNGQGRGCLPADHPNAVSRGRGTALQEADLVVVVGTPLDFRVGYGSFGEAEVVHVADHPDGLATHRELRAGIAGDLAAALHGLAQAAEATAGTRTAWLDKLRDAERAGREGQRELLESDAHPIHPARIYGELGKVLDRDAVVIGDGGDYVSFGGKYVDSYEPGHWLDPGPFGCLGTGAGYAAAARIAHPDKQVVLLYGDGAAGFSLMDVDTLVRHNLPAVMVVGNNGIWALEKHPMQMLYDGWDTAADLRQETGYDEVVRALGATAETVDKPGDLEPALQRAFDSGVPYLVNVLTDPEARYPRKTFG
jgi:acetolactate synthase I/II/III large subunit